VQFTPQTRIADVLWALVSGREILERHGIDADQPEVTLEAAAAAAGAELEPLLTSLQGTYSLFHDHRSFPEEWVAATPVEIATVIRDVYHAQLRRLLPSMAKRLSFVMLECGSESPELYDIGRLFEQLDRELQQHWTGGENDLTPLLRGQRVDSRQLERMVERMEADHFKIARLVAEIRALTLDYPLRRYDCPTMTALYDEWREIEHLTMRSVFLEENKLVPLARDSL